MIKTSPISLFVAVFLLVFALAPQVHAQNEGLVGSVKIEGNKRVDDSTLL